MPQGFMEKGCHTRVARRMKHSAEVVTKVMAAHCDLEEITGIQHHNFADAALAAEDFIDEEDHKMLCLSISAAGRVKHNVSSFMFGSSPPGDWNHTFALPPRSGKTKTNNDASCDSTSPPATVDASGAKDAFVEHKPNLCDMSQGKYCVLATSTVWMSQRFQ